MPAFAKLLSADDRIVVCDRGNGREFLAAPNFIQD